MLLSSGGNDISALPGRESHAISYCSNSTSNNTVDGFGQTHLAGGQWMLVFITDWLAHFLARPTQAYSFELFYTLESSSYSSSLSCILACHDFFESVQTVLPRRVPASQTMAILAQYLFGTSAFLNAVSILGHARFGLQTTYPALKTIPSTHEHTLGKTSARVSYDFANATLAIAGEFCTSLIQGERVAHLYQHC